MTTSPREFPVSPHLLPYLAWPVFADDSGVHCDARMHCPVCKNRDADFVLCPDLGTFTVQELLEAIWEHAEKQQP